MHENWEINGPWVKDSDPETLSLWLYSENVFNR